MFQDPTEEGENDDSKKYRVIKRRANGSRPTHTGASEASIWFFKFSELQAEDHWETGKEAAAARLVQAANEKEAGLDESD